MNGLGPDVLNTITPIGTVRLETLDDGQMTNFIKWRSLEEV